MVQPTLQPETKTLLGLEEELRISMKHSVNLSKLTEVCTLLFASIPQLTKCLPDERRNGKGYMLANGSRCYLDGVRYLEIATPEVLDPMDILTWRAGTELIVNDALSRAIAKVNLRSGEVSLIRSVTDYGGSYCGSHLNILSNTLNAEEMTCQLYPFLITRYYACAGGWSNRGFVMSQKGAALNCVQSPDTRQKRGIVNTRQEDLAQAPFKRIHLTHQDALMSNMSNYLTAGCTTLVVNALSAGMNVGSAFALLEPVESVRQLDHDPTWKTPLRLACGGEASALEIQRHYFQACEQYVRGKSHPWMHRVLELWKETLDLLEHNPPELALYFDPWIKMNYYSQELLKLGFSMREFQDWCQVVEQVGSYLDDYTPNGRSLRATMRGMLPRVVYDLVEERIERSNLDWEALPSAMQAWRRMIALDIRYHDISPNGLFEAIKRSTPIKCLLTNFSEIAAAKTTAPKGTRAQARYKHIDDKAGHPDVFATWDRIVDLKNKSMVELSDPYITEAEWKPFSASQRRQP